MPPKPQPAISNREAAIVAKAALKAADKLDLTDKTLAAVIGVSGPTVSRMRDGEYTLENKPFELAVLFLRLFRSLDAIVGGDEAVARNWLKNRNTALNAPPIDLIKTVPGLMHVVQYLDARRAIV
jgi:uncharacterized protein (DUF2384 family)